MDGKRPRLASALVLIASSFLGQAAILAAIIALLFAAVHVSQSTSARPGNVVLLPFRTPLVPAYYAALSTTGAAGRLGPLDITIRDTTSGAILATVAPPPGIASFNLVGGTGEGEFLVAAQSWYLPQPDGLQPAPVDAAPVKLYTLRFDAGAHVTTLTPLPLPEIPGTQFWTAALSPDGSKVAIAVTPGGTDLPGTPQQVRVYTLPGGAERTWTAAGPGGAFTGWRLDPRALSWSADDRTLAVNWRDPAPTVRLLDTQAAGRSLLAASRLAVSLDGTAFACNGDAVLTAGGTLLACAGNADPASAAGPVQAARQVGFGEFSAATGRLAGVLHPVLAPGCCTGAVPVATLIWASPSGNVFIETETSARQPTGMTVITGGERQDIPLSPQVAGAAW
jgi:hypothetical protein